MSPFELLVGTKMRDSNDLKLKEFIEDEWRELFLSQREEMRRMAKEQIRKIQEQNRRGINKKGTAPSK